MSDKPMTLAEAIKLGATHMKPKAGTFHNRNWTEGCAIGMAQFAHGKITLKQLRKLHPVIGSTSSFAADITMMFDYRVAPNTRVGDTDCDCDSIYSPMTFDELVDAVAVEEHEFEARRAAARATTVAAPAKTTTKAAKKSRKAVKTPA